MARRRNKKSISFTTIFFILILLGAIGGGIAAYILFFEGDAPQLSFDNSSTFLGKEAIIAYKATDKGNGLHSITITAIQGDLKYDIYSKVFPRTSYTGAIGPLEQTARLEFNPLKAGFKDGEIELQITATDFSARNILSGNTATLHKKVILDTKPPHLRVLHTDQYISNGGSGIVIYESDDPHAKQGIEANGIFFNGYPLDDGRENVFICYFALKYNATEIADFFLKAEDSAGNTSMLPLSTNFKEKKIVTDRINIGDGFLNKKIPEFQQYYPEMKGDMVEKYLYTNNQVRTANNATIKGLCENPSPVRFWQGRFIRMAGSSRAQFADYRSYYYKDKVIDKQVHLGMDIASTRKAHIKAANTGVVVFGEYLGIYGNMVLLDHGQGVFSLYSHMSQIDVAAGEKVERGDVIGLTGTTGMAGGDHLHFSMLVQGIFVTPKEWWDAHWIEGNIDGPILDSRF